MASSSTILVGGLALPAPPVATEAPAALFQNLADTFKFDQKIATWLVDMAGLQTIPDFTEFLTSSAQVEERITSKIADVQFPGRNAARIRQAWEAVAKAQGDVAGKLKKKEEAGDMDILLPTEDLNLIKQNFWARYHLDFGLAVEPSDYLLSRIFKELTRRLMQIYCIWQVRSMQRQTMAERKRRQLGGGLELIEAEQESEEVMEETMANYLACLYTLCLVYAKAGCNPIDPAPAEAETRFTKTTDYIETPLDVVLRYHGRAVVTANLMQPHAALGFVSKRDGEGRATWAEQHRATRKPLGQIIETTFEKRDGHWEPPEHLLKSKKAGGGGGGGGGRGSGGGGGGGGDGAGRKRNRDDDGPARTVLKAGPGGQGGGADGGDRFIQGIGNKRIKIAATAANGDALCPAWQGGGCRDPCPKGMKHACAAYLVKRGTKYLCMMTNHRASQCKRAIPF